MTAPTAFISSAAPLKAEGGAAGVPSRNPRLLGAEEKRESPGEIPLPSHDASKLGGRQKAKASR